MVTTGLTVVASGALLRARRSPQATVAWLLAIVLMPYIGLPLYLALGARKERRLTIPFPTFPEGNIVAEVDAPVTDRLLRHHGLPGASGDNAVQLLQTGEAAYPALIDLVERAQRSVWVTLFILGDDDAGHGFLEALSATARRGLDVRLILDAVGARPLPKGRLASLRAAGGHVAFFEPLLHRPFRGRSNLRNHRKIFLADETHAMAGGMNVAHEHMGPAHDPTRWSDLAFLLDGPTVADLVALFRSDWSWASRLPLPDPGPVPALRDVQDAGGHVLRCTRGMVHAKALVSDGLALVGSANLDPRSLFLNSEVAIVLYDAPEVGVSRVGSTGWPRRPSRVC